MAKVTVRKETGKLLLDFTFKGVRCREQTALQDTPANRKRVEHVLKRLTESIRSGSFTYSAFFPGSPNVAKFEVGVLSSQQQKQSTEPSSVANKTGGKVTPTFRDFATTWLAEHEVEWRRSHQIVLRSTLTTHLLPRFGDCGVHEISKADLMAFRTELSQLPGRAASRMGNRRINGIMGPLRQILAEAADRHGFVSPATNIKPLRLRRTDVQPFTLDQVQQILARVRPDWRNYFAVRFFTGMRTGEAHGLKWKYVDFGQRLILIRETFVLGEDEYTKTDSSQRDIQMSQVVYEALKAQYAATGSQDGHVFCNREGRPLDNKNFTDRVWYPLLRHLGLEERRPYQMRHTAATLWLASGEAPEWIARQLGHGSTEMLFRVYSRYVPNLTRRDGSAIDRLLATRFASGAEPAAGTAT